MKINFNPVFGDERLLVSLEGETLWVNGDDFDLSPLLEGATLPATATNSKWFFNELTRTNGEIELTLTLPHALDAPEEVRFPQPITVTEDGHIEVPGEATIEHH